MEGTPEYNLMCSILSTWLVDMLALARSHEKHRVRALRTIDVAVQGKAGIAKCRRLETEEERQKYIAKIRIEMTHLYLSFDSWATKSYCELIGFNFSRLNSVMKRMSVLDLTAIALFDGKRDAGMRSRVQYDDTSKEEEVQLDIFDLVQNFKPGEREIVSAQTKESENVCQ